MAPSFDFAEMARRALGQYWHRLTPPQQEEFVQLFSTLALHSLVERIVSRTKIDGYGSVPNAIQYLRETIDPAGDASVRTAIPGNGEGIVTSAERKDPPENLGTACWSCC